MRVTVGPATEPSSPAAIDTHRLPMMAPAHPRPALRLPVSLPPGAHPTDGPKVHDQNRRRAKRRHRRMPPGRRGADALLQPQVVVLPGFADPLTPTRRAATPTRVLAGHTRAITCSMRPLEGPPRHRLAGFVGIGPGPTSAGATASPSRMPHHAAAAARSPRR